MSVFRVKLNNTQQGLLDLDPSTASGNSVHGRGLGSQMSTSKQRSVYITGPNRINRLLNDGDTFTDCNYWKRFAYPQVALNEAFIEVVTDDGSVYSDIASENTFPRVYNIYAAPDTTYADNQADILGDTGGYAIFAQITNTSTTVDVRIRLNGSTSAVMDLPRNSTQVFNAGDLSISMIEVDNSVSGTGPANGVDVQIVVSVRSIANS